MGAHPQFGKAMSSAEYAAEWTKSADGLASMNAYVWMCEQLGAAENVMEVGCGSGESTLSLLDSDRSLLSVDINENLIQATRDRLVKAGKSVQAIVSANDKLNTSPSIQATLLLADAATAPIPAALTPLSLDAIVCWLIGAPPGIIARTFDKAVPDLTGEEMAAYREKIHRRCYEMGTLLLKPGGVVHIVDRVLLGSWAEKDEARNSAMEVHQSWAGQEYTLSKQNVMLRRLDNLGASSISYLATSQSPTNGVLVLCSTKAVKT